MAITYSISQKGIDEVNDFFTTFYDYDYWSYKLKSLEIFLEDDRLPQEFVKREVGDGKYDRFRLFVKSELVFVFFHLAESLFSLMMTCLHSKCPWVDMKSIRVKQICDFVRKGILGEKLSDENIRFLFYHGVVGDEAKKESIVSSIKFIKEYLKRMGEKFLEDIDLYDEYKHGLRLMPSYSSIRIIPEKMGEEYELNRAGPAFTYLTIKLLEKKGKHELREVRRATKSFDYNLYLRLASVNLRLIESIFYLRNQKGKLKPGDQVSVQLYNTADIKELFKTNPAEYFQFSVTVR